MYLFLKLIFQLRKVVDEFKIDYQYMKYAIVIQIIIYFFSDNKLTDAFFERNRLTIIC